MYAVEDTTPNDDEVNGYEDALFCSVKIYLPAIGKVYKVDRHIDAVKCDLKSDVRVFKDGSTCITINKPCTVSIWHALEISGVEFAG